MNSDIEPDMEGTKTTLEFKCLKGLEITKSNSLQVRVLSVS